MGQAASFMASSNSTKGKSQSSIRSTRPHFRVHDPSSEPGVFSEYDSTDNVPNVPRLLDLSLSGDPFKRAIVSLLHELNVSQWRSVPIEAASFITVRRIDGALTNSIYQIALPNDIEQCEGYEGLPRMAPKLLLRVYGAHVEHLIDRTQELVMLKRLSRNNIGPLLLGTFDNGRFEQWFDSHALSRSEFRDPDISCSIARRIRELHDGVELTSTERHSSPTVWTSLDQWLPQAREIIARRRRKRTGRLSDQNVPALSNPRISWQPYGIADSLSNTLILGQRWTAFELAVGRYRRRMEELYPLGKLKHALAFCHNDAQYGNVLLIENQGQLASDSRDRDLILIDFEYASPNPRAYDLANHFCEWMYNYHSETPFIANTDEYPSTAERSHFLDAYIAHGRDPVENKDDAIRGLEKEIRDWRVVSHAFWCVWAIVMSGDDPELDFPNGDGAKDQVVEGETSMGEGYGATAADFDYIAYADQKMRLFWGELASREMFGDYKDNVEGSKVIND